MGLKAIHDSLEEIPEEFQALYSERNGKYELTGVEGVKTQADVDRLNESLRKERNDHKATKEALSRWGDLDHDDVLAKLDRIPELEAAAGDKIDESKLNEMVEARLATRVAPLERENSKLKQGIEERDGMITGFKQQNTQRAIHDSVRKVARPSDGPKILDTAMDDVLMLAERVFEVREDDNAIVTRDGVGVTPGVTPQEWLAEMQQKRPHWWPASQGSGAGGGDGNGGSPFVKNPWSADHWNLTEQGKVFQSQGAEVATRMAKAAGSSIGATAPTPKK